MNGKRLWFWLWAGAALATGLLLRLWFVAHMPKVDGDSLYYSNIAKTWLRHSVYGVTESDPDTGITSFRATLSRVPGYPMFLAACFRLFGMDNFIAVVRVQAIIDLFTCWLAGSLAGRLFGCRAQLPVLWIAALCPFTAAYASVVLAETLVFATIALALYAFTRWHDAGLGYNRWLWIIPAALAYSILLRPEQGLLAAAMMPPMLWAALTTPDRRHRLVRSSMPVVVAAFCVILPLVPWTIRNARVFHVFQPLAPRSANDPGELDLHGFSHWYDTWAFDFASTDEVSWNMDGAPIDFASIPPRAFDLGTPAASEDLRRRTAELFVDYNKTLVLTPQLDARFDALATELIHAHPFRYYVGLHVARVLDMAFRPRTDTWPVADEWWQWSEHPGQTMFALSAAALNLAYFILALVGLSIWKRRAWLPVRETRTGLPGGHGYRELAAAMVATIVLRCLLLLFIDNSEPRYTLEFFPVFFVWMGALFTAQHSLGSRQVSLETAG